MPFPRGRSVASLYLEGGHRYIMVLNANGITSAGVYDAVGNAGLSEIPHCVCGASAHRDYIRTLRRVEWADLPLRWKDAFRPYLNDSPESTVGLHRIPKRS